MPRLLLLAVISSMLFPSAARASEAMGTTEKLLGWSEDGKTWAVLSINEGAGEEELLVKTFGVVVLTLCAPSEEELGDGSAHCENRKASKVVNIASGEKYSALERINIEKHKYLKAYKLKRVKGNWRKAFKKSFKLKSADPDEDFNGNKCKTKWIIESRADKKAVGSHKVKSGCLSASGGYLHPNGKYALIKHEHNTWASADEDDGFWTHDGIEYVLVPMKKPAALKKAAAAAPR